MKHPINCIVCGEFESSYATAKYCSDACERRQKRPTVPSPYAHLSTTALGALSELRAATDLMEKNWQVYRAVSPASSCDLIAVKAGKVVRIEVRTGSIKNGKLCFGTKAADAGRSDHYAVVLPDQIIYQPALPLQ